MPADAPQTFLTIAGTTVPVTRTGTASRQPDGQGKHRWSFSTAPVEPSVLAALETAQGTPSGADSDRAWDGTLMTDRPLASVGGIAMGGGTVACELTISEAGYRHYRDPSTGALRFRYVVTFTLREG